VGRAPGQRPVRCPADLTVEGLEPLGQTNAILTLVGRQHGLLPADELEAARHLAVMCAVELRAKMEPTNRAGADRQRRRR
jgi:hypothetical protein